MSRMGKVYLVGAGCGSFDLITLRGAQLLQQCDAVVYDSLIDMRLLELAPSSAEKICVGKRAGRHSEVQENINRIIEEKAIQGKTVVRLKGGDPFVFGRGGEEALALRKQNIPYSVVPGISSAAAVPELAGIPVTHRRLSRSFHVIAGHTADGLLPDNLRKYACLDGTLVFLMGLNNIRKIADGLLRSGMRSDVRTAVISCGGTPQQRTLRASLGDIADIVEKEALTAPAVIVVGEVAGLNLSPTIDRQLNGVSVTVTGTEHFTKKLALQLAALGADVKRLELLKISEYKENKLFDEALNNIEAYGWLALTSANGAEILLNRLKCLKIDIRKLSAVKIAVIGRGTSEFLEKNGIFPELIPESFTTAQLGKSLSESAVNGERILILRAEGGSPDLTKPLELTGIPYDDIKIYNAVHSYAEKGGALIDTDFLTFASSSGADTFFDGGYSFSEKTRIICIGEATAKALEKRGVKDFTVSDVQTAAGIADTISDLSFNVADIGGR